MEYKDEHNNNNGGKEKLITYTSSYILLQTILMYKGFLNCIQQIDHFQTKSFLHVPTHH